MGSSLVNKTLSAVIAASVMLFCLGTIVWLIAYGQPANSLHASALSWSYLLLIVTLAALGAGTIAEKVLAAVPTAPKASA